MNNALHHDYAVAKSSLKSWLIFYIDQAKLTQSELNTIKHNIVEQFATSRKRVPQYMVNNLTEYGNGIYDVYMRDKTVFLYKHQGKFYRANNNKNIHTAHLPTWEETPEYKIKDLANPGGFYWASNLAPFFTYDN